LKKQRNLDEGMTSPCLALGGSSRFDWVAKREFPCALMRSTLENKTQSGDTVPERFQINALSRMLRSPLRSGLMGVVVTSEWEL
jgi:hypothetical protein